MCDGKGFQKRVNQNYIWQPKKRQQIIFCQPAGNCYNSALPTKNKKEKHKHFNYFVLFSLARTYKLWIAVEATYNPFYGI